MKINDYLKINNIAKCHFAKKIGISRVTLDYYIRRPDKATQVVKIAIEYITAGEVNRNDWDKD